MSQEPKVPSRSIAEYATILLGILLVAIAGGIISVVNPSLPMDLLQKIAAYVAQFQ